MIMKSLCKPVPSAWSLSEVAQILSGGILVPGGALDELLVNCRGESVCLRLYSLVVYDVVLVVLLADCTGWRMLYIQRCWYMMSKLRLFIWNSFSFLQEGDGLFNGAVNWRTVQSCGTVLALTMTSCQSQADRQTQIKRLDYHCPAGFIYPPWCHHCVTPNWSSHGVSALEESQAKRRETNELDVFGQTGMIVVWCISLMSLGKADLLSFLINNWGRVL